MRRDIAWVATLAAVSFCAAAGAAPTNNILITGYWPPTNEMIRPWSQNPAQNAGAYVGANWEGRGYNVYAYFPEFPGGTTANPKGNGDLEVDYQDTAADWAQITAAIRPVAIITFSRANTTRGWELEPAFRRFRLSGESNPPGQTIPLYTSDYLAPLQPSNVPVSGEPLGTIRSSSLPMQGIVDAVAAQMTTAQIDPFVQVLGPTFDYAGAFLSGYIGYLGVWYYDSNNTASAANRCYAAGHIHVGMSTTVPNARQATEITLRTLIAHLNTIVQFCPADFNRDGSAGVQDLFEFLAAWFANDPRANVNNDAGIGVQDIFDYLAAWFAGC